MHHLCNLPSIFSGMSPLSGLSPMVGGMTSMGGGVNPIQGNNPLKLGVNPLRPGVNPLRPGINPFTSMYSDLMRGGISSQHVDNHTGRVECNPAPTTCPAPQPWCQRLPDSNTCITCVCGKGIVYSYTPFLTSLFWQNVNSIIKIQVSILNQLKHSLGLIQIMRYIFICTFYM